MKKLRNKIISVLVAVVLIIIVAAIAFGGKIKESMANGEEIGLRWFLALIYPEKYSYSMQMADMNEYFQLFAQDDIAIILQDERIDDRGKLIDGTVYFSITTVEKLFTDRFYVNADGTALYYTKSDEVRIVNIGEESNGYYVNGEWTPLDYKAAQFDTEGTLYIAAEYVKNYANFTYEFFPDPNRMKVRTEWDTHRETTVLKDTQVRYQGGIKSDVLCQAAEGDRVTVIEIMETWTKVLTKDGFIGYIENDKLADYEEIVELPVSGAYDPTADYHMTSSADGKLTIVFHQVTVPDDGSGFNELYASTSGIDVVSPTWFYLNNTDGSYLSIASKAYVENAHAKGLQVWALIEDMTYEADEYELFSSADNRQALISNLIQEALELGIDGINIDFEKITRESATHYVQFLRELSIETHKNGLILSVDNYMPNEGNRYYNLKEQGYVADYVILMGYDEHWAGSAESGSVASIGFVEKGLEDALALGVPENKLINAVPFYTRIWRTEGVEVKSEAYSMSVVQEWLANRGLTPEWDDVTGQYYASYQDGTAFYEVWIENADSLNVKLNIMSSYNLAGVAAWKLGLESADVWPVINSYME